MEIVAQNFHSRFGEIDIIAKKDEQIHFIEVKATSKDYDALYRITPQKLEKIIKTIGCYLNKNSLNNDYQIDAIIVNDKKIEWIKNISQ